MKGPVPMGQEKMRPDETRLETKSSLESLESPDKTCLVRSMRALLWILLMKGIQTLTIPSDSTLQCLAIQLPIAMENGFVSLVIPQDLSQLFLPLWVITYWK